MVNEKLEEAIKSMINISDTELKDFTKLCSLKEFKKKQVILSAGKYVNDVYFVNNGLIRVIITDLDGNEHTQHFATENQFITDYNAYLTKLKSKQTLIAHEKTEVISIPRSAIDWGYINLIEGEKLGRLIAEYYFVYLDTRIQNLYTLSPYERYETLNTIFPNIHSRVPQHMIASYLGISPVHLSRIKKSSNS